MQAEHLAAFMQVQEEKASNPDGSTRLDCSKTKWAWMCFFTSKHSAGRIQSRFFASHTLKMKEKTSSKPARNRSGDNTVWRSFPVFSVGTDRFPRAMIPILAVDTRGPGHCWFLQLWGHREDLGGATVKCVNTEDKKMEAKGVGIVLELEWKPHQPRPRQYLLCRDGEKTKTTTKLN